MKNKKRQAAFFIAVIAVITVITAIFELLAQPLQEQREHLLGVLAERIIAVA